MREVRFLCLAVSRREGGNCVAGMDIDSGQWLRPIRSRERAAFADADLVVEDNRTHQARFLAPLDLLSLPLEECIGSNSQPENWVVTPALSETPPPVLRHCTGPRTADFLLTHLDRSELLLHSATDSVPCDAFADRPLSNSLSLVRPVDLTWTVAPNAKHAGKAQVRAEFCLGKTEYSLVVTDPVWEAKCIHEGMGRHAHAVFSSVENELAFLTVSLAAIPFHGLHYKLVAGVIEIGPARMAA